MDIKKYLETCSREELAEVLLSIPGVRDYLVNKHITEKAVELAATIPNQLIADFYIEEVLNGPCSVELKRYILDHFSGSDVHILFKHFKFNKLCL